LGGAALQPLVEESGGELAGEMAMPLAKAYVKRVKSLVTILRRAIKRLDKVGKAASAGAGAGSVQRDGPKLKRERVPLLEAGDERPEAVMASGGNTPDAKRQATVKRKAVAEAANAVTGEEAKVMPSLSIEAIWWTMDVQ